MNSREGTGVETLLIEKETDGNLQNINYEICRWSFKCGKTLPLHALELIAISIINGDLIVQPYSNLQSVNKAVMELYPAVKHFKTLKTKLKYQFKLLKDLWKMSKTIEFWPLSQESLLLKEDMYRFRDSLTNKEKRESALQTCIFLVEKSRQLLLQLMLF